MEGKHRILGVICLAISALLAGCTNVGSKGDLTRDLAAKLISESQPLPKIVYKTSWDGGQSVPTCLKDLGLTQKGLYTPTKTATEQLGLGYSDRRYTFEPEDPASIRLNITGIKPAPRFSGGEQAEYKIAVFNYESDDPSVSSMLACFVHDALFIQYDDGWRVENINLKR